MQLGSLKDINTGVIEGLYASDLGYLEELYADFNAQGDAIGPAASGKANGGHSLHRIAALGEA